MMPSTVACKSSPGPFGLRNMWYGTAAAKPNLSFCWRPGEEAKGPRLALMQLAPTCCGTNLSVEIGGLLQEGHT